MDGYTHAHCLFCETGKEEHVVRAIHESEWGYAIFAQRVKVVWKNHEHREETTPLLPGYVFVYSDRKDTSGIDYQKIPHVIRILSYENGVDKLTGRDLEFADWLWHQGGTIGLMKAVQIGDRVEIVDDLFKGLHGKITRMNRTRKNISVMLNTKSTPMQIMLSYEIIEKINSKK